MKIDSFDKSNLNTNKIKNNKLDNDCESYNYKNTDKTNYIVNTNFENISSEKILKEAIDYANDKLKVIKKEFSYSVHEKLNRVMVKVIDSETKEVIKEIPPEKIMDIIAKIEELSGLLYDKTI